MSHAPYTEDDLFKEIGRLFMEVERLRKEKCPDG
jgi:hypothetical protein